MDGILDDEDHTMDEDTKEIVTADKSSREASQDYKMGSDKVDYFAQPASLPPSFSNRHKKVLTYKHTCSDVCKFTCVYVRNKYIHTHKHMCS